MVTHTTKTGTLKMIAYIGPGLLVTAGFIDPGNWAANVAGASHYGLGLLWVITLSTLMLIVLQHNAAHLGIVTGLCLSEASTKFFPKAASRIVLTSALAAAVSTALAEILGAAIGLQMLFGLPLRLGAIAVSVAVTLTILKNSYQNLERWVIGFVALIGLSFVFELSLVRTHWLAAAKGWCVPVIPKGSLPLIMGMLGAVVMPHNIFLHSEIIQSRHGNTTDETVTKKQLRYAFADTLFAMMVGWAINSAMIIVAASVFYTRGIVVTELNQAQETLRPLVGNASALIFALALLCAGFSSVITAAVSGASIFAGIFQEPLDLTDSHSRLGALLTIAGGLAAVFCVNNPFQGLILSQVLLSVQLPITIFALMYLTSSGTVMGKFKNTLFSKYVLWGIGLVISFLNALLVVQVFKK
ncbi:MAG TPA: Nramp family divalent metal transporter [Patescibacteria group bacterium]|nr:Nramp family divalent metal transporter [Patescibacteria group bacterium]